MYAIEVRDHIMIAHSFRGDVFGPAQKLHGATFVVDVAFYREELNADGIVIDIGRALDTLKATLEPLNYTNLDDNAAFEKTNSTTEVLCKHIFDAMRDAAKSDALGPGSDGLTKIRVKLSESHVARAWYEAAL